MQHAYGQYGTAFMKIKKLQIQVTGTYGHQFSRPFQAQVDSNIIDQVSQRMIETRGSITGAMFSSGAGVHMIAPSATPERNIIIANGWDIKRLRFVLQIERGDHLGTSQFVSVSGFTDHADTSFSGYIDPRTRFYINSVSVAIPQRIKSAYGQIETLRNKSSNQLVVNRDFQGVLLPNQGGTYSIAPDSIFSHLQASEYQSQLHNDSVLDTRGTLTGKPRLMQRAHNSAPQYCASILETWNSVHNASEYSYSNDKVMDECMQTLQAPLADSDPFLAFLMKRKQDEYGYLSSFDGSFTYADLLALDAAVDSVKMFAPDLGGLHQVGQSSDWSSSDGVTLAAASLAQAVPSYMAQVGIDVFRFNATNNTIGSQIAVIPVAVAGFSAQNNQRNEAEALCFRLCNEVLASITHGNNVSFDLEMHVDLYGETWIELSMNGQAPALYVAPTFADSLAVPTVTTDSTRIDNICYDMKSVFNNVWEHKASAVPSSHNPFANGLKI